jgi:hypothetical protein
VSLNLDCPLRDEALRAGAAAQAAPRQAQPEAKVAAPALPPPSSDSARELRAAAAERRLGLVSCARCGSSVLRAVSFERFDKKFCGLDCLRKGGEGGGREGVARE